MARKKTKRIKHVLPAYSKELVEKVKSEGIKKMEHFLGQNMEDRGGMTHIETVAQNYVDSLTGLALDRPPSCHEKDLPGQGTWHRDLQLKKTKADVELMQVSQKFIQTEVNSCNACSHDLLPEDANYQEMEEAVFKPQNDMTIQPGYQETMSILMSLPAEGMVLLEPARSIHPLTLAMAYAITNMVHSMAPGN